MDSIINDRNIKRYLKYFKNKLSSLNVDETLYNKNIQTLQIVKSNNLDNIVIGYYDFIKNIIEIKDRPLDSIYHELLHMSSRKKDGNIYMVGLSYVNKKTNTNLGYGLNEELTDLLDSIYFSKTKVDKTLFRYYALKLLSFVIDFDTLIKYYFKADLKSLDRMISETSSPKTSLLILSSLDNIYDAEIGLFDVKYIDQEYKNFYQAYINLFLSSLCQNYLLEKISKDDLIDSTKKVKNFALEKVNINNKIYPILNEKEFESIKDEVFFKKLRK